MSTTESMPTEQTPLHQVPLTADEQELNDIARWFDEAQRKPETSKFLRAHVRYCITQRATIADLRRERDELKAALEGTLSWLTSYPGHGADKAYDRARVILDRLK